MREYNNNAHNSKERSEFIDVRVSFARVSYNRTLSIFVFFLLSVWLASVSRSAGTLFPSVFDFVISSSFSFFCYLKFWFVSSFFLKRFFPFFLSFFFNFFTNLIFLLLWFFSLPLRFYFLFLHFIRCCPYSLRLRLFVHYLKISNLNDSKLLFYILFRALSASLRAAAVFRPNAVCWF